MHPFSSCLNTLLTTRNIKKTALSQHLNMDRSTLHQFLNGKRLPASPEIIDAIASYLSLSPEEHAALKEAWIIEKITPLLIGLNIKYKSHYGGLRITGIPALDKD